MFAKERQDKIYFMVKNSGAVATSNLVKTFNVSTETIRRDLLEMERDGRLLRVHGGAVEKSGMIPYKDLTDRSAECEKQKQDLALTAAEFVSDGDIIAIDTGSTTAAFARALSVRLSRLTVVTHSLEVFDILRDRFSVILCGGHYMPEEKSFYGALTIDMFNSLHVQKAFLCPSAVSLKYGICDYQKDLYQIQKCLIELSDDIFILADSSKFEKKALLKIDDTSNDYVYITDSDLSESIKKLYAENNIQIYMKGCRK